MRRRKRLEVVAFLLTPIGILAAVLALFTAMNSLQDGQGQESLLQLKNSLRRAAVTCYATEGIYPPTLVYLQENYGIQIDEKQFTVFYDAFADNRMPDITVLPYEEAEA